MGKKMYLNIYLLLFSAVIYMTRYIYNCFVAQGARHSAHGKRLQYYINELQEVGRVTVPAEKIILEPFCGRYGDRPYECT